MRNILIRFLSLFVIGFLSSCDKDKNLGGYEPALKLSEVLYTLEADRNLEIELHSSVRVERNTVVKLNFRGAAVEGEEYEVSAKEFVFQAGDSIAKITVTPKNNYASDKTIRLELLPVEGFQFDEFNFALIQIMAKSQLICAFEKSSYVLPQEVEVTMMIKNAATGGYYSIHPQEFRVPFEIDESSTAIEGVNYEIVNNLDKEIVFKANNYKGTVNIRLLKWEEGKTNIYLKVNTSSERFLAGNIDLTDIFVKGPTTLKNLLGKWAFQEAFSWDYVVEYKWGSDAEVANLPKNNTSGDILEFIDEGCKLKTHLTGDLAKYFRDCDVKFLKEKLIYLFEQGAGMRPPQVTISVMELSSANVLFAASKEKLRPVQIGFRLMEDMETLEVSLYDYEPIDFLYETYQMVADWSDDGVIPMEDTMPLRFHFKKIE